MTREEGIDLVLNLKNEEPADLVSFKLGELNNEEFKDYYWNNRDLNIWKKRKW